MITTTVNIITDYATAMRFKNLSQFELDLGKKNLAQAQNGKFTVMKIGEDFVEFIFKKYGFLIKKIGKYGKISFYYMNFNDADKVYVFFDERENEIQIPRDLLNNQLEEWLSVELFKILEKNNNLTNASN